MTKEIGGLYMVARMTTIFIILNILTPIFASQFNEVNIAILDFEGNGLEKNEIAMVSEKFRSSLIEFSKYRIMERASMNDLLKEQGFQQTGACNSNSCLIQAGQVLGATFMVAGKISAANGITAISVRIIDVGTGEILLARSKEYQVLFFDFVSKEIPAFVKEFITGIDKSLNEFAIKHKKGILFVESAPENGTVSIDGLETGRITPTTFKDMNAGKHEILVNSGKMVGRSETNVIPGKLSKCSVVLEIGYGSLRVQSNLSGLTVEIPGIGNFPIPTEIDSLPTGSHLIRCNKEGYFPFESSIDIHALKTTEMNINLEEMTYLMLDGVTDDSRIKLDDQAIRTDLNTPLKIPAGKHKLEVKRDGYRNGEFQILTNHNDTTIYTVHYFSLPSTLTITTNSVVSDISLNGADAGKTPATFSTLQSGNYKVVLSNKKYQPISKNITLKPGSNSIIAEMYLNYSDDYVNWNRKKDKFRFANLGLAGIGQIALERDALGISLFSAGLISDAFLGFSGYRFYSHTNKMEAAKHKIEENYFKERRKDDLVWAISSCTTSILLRTLTFIFTMNKEYK